MKKKPNHGSKASSEIPAIPLADGDRGSGERPAVGRRSFLKGLGATSALLLPASALLTIKTNAANDDSGGRLSKGDAAILRFLAAAEILESDLWEQYWELGSATGIKSGFASHRFNRS